MTMQTMVDHRGERHRAAMSRLRAFGRELRKIVSVTLSPTNEEVRRMECLCVAIGDTIADKAGYDCFGWDYAAYQAARDIIARHKRPRGKGNG